MWLECIMFRVIAPGTIKDGQRGLSTGLSICSNRKVNKPVGLCLQVRNEGPLHNTPCQRKCFRKRRNNVNYVLFVAGASCFSLTRTRESCQGVNIMCSVVLVCAVVVLSFAIVFSVCCGCSALLRLRVVGVVLLGVAQTVFLGKPCFYPLPKRGRLDENGENDEFAFYPLKTRASLLKPPKTTKIAKATAWFRKSRLCSSLICC